MPDYEAYYDYETLRRGEFPDNSRIVDDQEFCDRLSAIDPDAEVLWNPRREPPTWSLYRVTHYGASPADDVLTHEFDIPGAPGEHVIRRMQARQLIRPGGAQSLPNAKKDFMDRVKKMITRRREEGEKDWQNFMHDFRGNLDTYVRKLRKSDAKTRFERRNLKPSIRANSPRIHVPQGIDKVTGTVHQEDKPLIVTP